MQETRRHILDILKERGQATVDDIVTELRLRRGDEITAVTVRHHLSCLQKDNLITTPQLRHRTAPGRPQHVYMLTDDALAVFPNNYQPLAECLIDQLCANLPQREVNVILEGVADRMAADARIPNLPLGERVHQVVEYLNQHGYNAVCEKQDEGYVLRTSNCPYHHISQTNHSLCEMDMRLIASMLGIVPRLIGRMSAGDTSCAYLIPEV
jgi:predicted ArsR family transcriptional regulator